MKKVLLIVMALLLTVAGLAGAEEQTWLQIGGDYRFRVDSLKGTVHDYNQIIPNGTAAPTFQPVPGYTVQNDILYTNRFGLNLKAEPVEDVVFKARLVMYKVAGHQTSGPFMGNFFADRSGPFDGVSGHVPEDNTLRVDYLYSTVNNIFDAPIWFSVGRRPSTGGLPGNLRQNQEKIGTAGIPSILVDYAFDGATLGYAPDIEALPGAYAKLCYGRGFENGFDHGQGGQENNLRDMDFLGLTAVPYDDETIHLEIQYQTGSNIFDHPSDPDAMGQVTANLGDIHWLGGVVTATSKNLNFFIGAAASRTDPNENTSQLLPSPYGPGLLWDASTPRTSRTGNAIYLGGRYDIESTKTKVGIEYNQGSKWWIGQVPAGDDVWTSKLGTRGSVYEVYLIQELDRKSVSKKGKAFARLGYQYYKFEYTGSNNWLGAPVKISDLNTAGPPQMFAPLEDAKDLYLIFDVQF